MNLGFPDQRIGDRIKEYYPTGARVELVRMNDTYIRISPGTMGTVLSVDDIGTIHVRWDNGYMLGVAYGVDEARRVKE